MSDQAKTFQVMLLAFSLVMASGAAFYIGGENEGPEPGLPANTYMMLTYEVEGVLEGAPINGSFGVQMLSGQMGFGIMYTWPFNITGNLGPLATLPASIFGSGCFLVQSAMDTPWGEKQGMLYIGQRSTWNESVGVVFTYRGTHTGLAYRMDLVAPGVKATYSLAEVNITGMEDMDLRVGQDIEYLMNSRHLEGDYSVNMGGGGTWGLVEPRGSESYRVSFNATNYTFMAFGEQEILSMAVGGDFSYVEEWSMMGNGSREFVLSDQMMFYYLYPNVNAPGPTGLLVITVE